MGGLFPRRWPRGYELGHTNKAGRAGEGDEKKSPSGFPLRLMPYITRRREPVCAGASGRVSICLGSCVFQMLVESRTVDEDEVMTSITKRHNCISGTARRSLLGRDFPLMLPSDESMNLEPCIQSAFAVARCLGVQQVCSCALKCFLLEGVGHGHFPQWTRKIESGRVKYFSWHVDRL